MYRAFLVSDVQKSRSVQWDFSVFSKRGLGPNSRKFCPRSKILLVHNENRYLGVQIFEKFDSRVFKSGFLVHFLCQTYRKAGLYNETLAYLRKGAWNRIWQKSPNLALKRRRAGIYQLDVTKHL